jgi:hypothetical protein
MCVFVLPAGAAFRNGLAITIAFSVPKLMIYCYRENKNPIGAATTQPGTKKPRIRGFRITLYKYCK